MLREFGDVVSLCEQLFGDVQIAGDTIRIDNDRVLKCLDESYVYKRGDMGIRCYSYMGLKTFLKLKVLPGYNADKNGNMLRGCTIVPNVV